jgi:hypothetical protein
MLSFLKLRYAKRSPGWSAIRKKHLLENGFCAACGKTKNLEVHHIKPVHLFPDLELELSNLVTLCADPCHIVFGHFMDFKKWNKTVLYDCSEYFKKLKLFH